jgi:hypothetical protein
LLGEYKKALKGRASPPCGKVAGMLIHHTNLADAAPDRRKLVCYDCGVACDLSKMREDRLVALRSLGATERPAPRGALPVIDGDDMVDVSERGGGATAEHHNPRESARRERVRLAGFQGAGAPWTTYRVRLTKLGRAAFLGHLDLMRLLARALRRAELGLAVTRGFSPKPRMTFGPALSLGVPSLGEIVDVDLEHAAGAPIAADEVMARLGAVMPQGVELTGCEVVTPGVTPGLGKAIVAADLAIRPAPDGIVHDAARLARARSTGRTRRRSCACA